MKLAILFALFFAGGAAMARDPAPHGHYGDQSRHGRRPLWYRAAPERTVTVTRTTTITTTTAPAPVGEKSGQTVEGVIPRLLTARDPVQMINPLAPPGYGSARNLVVYTERDPYRTSNENKIRFQTDGIRLLTLRPLW